MYVPFHHPHTHRLPPSPSVFFLLVCRFIDSSCLHTQPGYMHTLASELANESSAVFVRNAAGLALKNALTARVRRVFSSLSLPLPFSIFVPSSSPPISYSPFPSPLTYLPASHRTARAKQSTPLAGLVSMSRSAARSRSLSCAGFTLSRSRPAQSLHRASQLSQPWSFRRVNGQILSRSSCALSTPALASLYGSRRSARLALSARCWCVLCSLF